jgi:hypothetical protein
MQLAHNIGARVPVTAGTADRIQQCLELGAKPEWGLSAPGPWTAPQTIFVNKEHLRALVKVYPVARRQRRWLLTLCAYMDDSGSGQRPVCALSGFDGNTALSSGSSDRR